MPSVDAPDVPVPHAASILDDGSGAAATVLADIVTGLCDDGCRVHGLLMTREAGPDRCDSTMVLTDVLTGDEYVVSQSLGSQSAACRADPNGFADASIVLRRALAQAPDVVVVNRFGSLEMEGGGFRSEFLDLLSIEVPLLTIVAARHQSAWREFTGGATVLPPTREAVRAWLDQAMASRTC